MTGDPVREKWVREYPGVTDDGKTLPISQVVPGIILNGIASGYFEAKDEEEAGKAWDWYFVTT